MDEGACWETASHSATQEIPRLCVGQQLIFMFIWLHPYTYIWSHISPLHTSSPYFPDTDFNTILSFYMYDVFADVLINNLHKISITGIRAASGV